jgi:hypothetical protein
MIAVAMKLSTVLTLGVILAAAVVLALCPGIALAEEGCPNEGVRAESDLNSATGAPYSAQLPDCRAYELVSPSNTRGYGAPSQELNSPWPIVQFSKDGSVFFMSSAAPAGTGAVGDGAYANVFRARRTSAAWVIQALTPFSGQGNNLLVKASPDGSAILIDTPLTLNPEDVDNPAANDTRGEDLYVLREGAPPQLVTHGEIPNTAFLSPSTIKTAATVFANAELTAVGFESDLSLQTPFASQVSTGCYMWEDAQSRLAFLTNPEGLGSPPPPNCAYFGIAADGAAIIENTSDSQPGLIYASSGGNIWPAAGGTVQLSGNTPGAAEFDALSSDGNTVYLTTLDTLVPNADPAADIYAIDLQAPSGLTPFAPPQGPAVHCVSCGHSGATGASFVGQSADGSTVFFTSDEGLWAWSRSTGQARLVAPATDALAEVVVSANGEHVTALSSAALSASDSNAASDVYEFSEQEGYAPRLITDGASVSARYGPVAVSDDGQRVLYEDRPVGHPQFINEWAAGQTTQISPLGAARDYSVLGTVGNELQNVFFESFEPLVAQDLNAGTVDIYDARVGGGFPVSTQPAPCAGEACQGAPSASAMGGSAPGSQLLSTPGNPPSPAPAKQNARKKHRKIDRKKSRRQVHHKPQKHRRTSHAGDNRRAGR